jgi:3-oxoacyl-[acyl-carrier-protein] synthase-1
MTFGNNSPTAIAAFTYTSCLGHGATANWNAIVAERSGLSPCRFHGITDLAAWVGEVTQLDAPLTGGLAAFDCRNNRLAYSAIQADGFLQQARDAVTRFGAHRVGIYMGTSTSGILQTEDAYQEAASNQFTELPDWYIYRTTHNVASLASFVQTLVGSSGPALTISTACSSSAKVFASAARAIDAGLIDAAVVGGVDTLCLTTLYGFNALQLVSPDPCRPFDRNRSGISIGEAGGFALLTRDHHAPHFLLGYGESSDAYHMSSPHPEGNGAYAAMKDALNNAGLTPIDIDYINLHGTGTLANDSAEARAVSRAFGDLTPASSTKGFTGHTLGAAGIIEICIGLQAIDASYLPRNIHLEAAQDDMSLALISHARTQKVERVLSNSFGFGGSNCSVIVGKPLGEIA